MERSEEEEGKGFKKKRENKFGARVPGESKCADNRDSPLLPIPSCCPPVTI